LRNMSAPPRHVTRAGHFTEVGAYFLRLGCIAFGGPAAHIALMRRELVTQKQWLTDEQFVDMLGVTNLIPGPNSTEMTMHTGYHRAGWAGLWIGGLAFILPAVVIVLAFAWAYVRYGDTPAGEGILAGVGPVVLAIIIQAIWGSATRPSDLLAAVVAAAVFVAVLLLGVNEIWRCSRRRGRLAWYLGRRFSSAAGRCCRWASGPRRAQAAAESVPTVSGLFWSFSRSARCFMGAATCSSPSSRVSSSTRAAG
jgi:chromate transporter